MPARFVPGGLAVLPGDDQVPGIGDSAVLKGCPLALIQFTPAQQVLLHAAAWLGRGSAEGIDGVVAKEAGQPYSPGKRT